MIFTELDEATREWMLRRFESEESGGNPYRSEVLSQLGLAHWPDVRRQAITDPDGSEVTLAAALNRPVTRCQVYRAGIPKWQQAECSVHEGQTYAVAEIIAGHQSAAAGYGALVQTVWVPRAPVATVNAAVSVCIDALTYPVARAFALLGRGASSVELHQLRQPLRSALTLT